MIRHRRVARRSGSPHHGYGARLLPLVVLLLGLIAMHNPTAPHNPTALHNRDADDETAHTVTAPGGPTAPDEQPVCPDHCCTDQVGSHSCVAILGTPGQPSAPPHRTTTVDVGTTQIDGTTVRPNPGGRAPPWTVWGSMELMVSRR